jgi:subtilisin-like proprotein convertase family protein
MKKLYSLLLFALFGSIANAQINEGGTPLSFGSNFPVDLFDVPQYVSPALDMNFVKEDDTKRETLGQAPHFGKHQFTNLTLENSGIWTDLPDGGRVWMLKIKAEDALGMVLYYKDFYLPEGAKYFVYTTDRVEVLGAFTSANNQELGIFGSFLTLTDECVLELYEPANAIGRSHFTLDKICHAYRYVKTRVPEKTGLDIGDSGSCNVDVVCTPEGTNWQDEKRGTVRLLSSSASGSAFCSGSLINNVRQDCTPYILTANHCSDTDLATDYASYFVQFNFYRPNCGSGTPIATNTIQGTTFKARSGGTSVSGSDFCLFQLNSVIPAAYNVYYNGFDATQVSSPSGVTIHHPSGDAMKISHYTAPTTNVLYSGAPGTTHWQANWVTTTNGLGITEPGSSGSPLFNNLGQIIGDLSGGPSSCTATNKWDYYGSMAYSWLNNAATANNRMLKPWLDPDNTGILSVPGTNAPCSGIRVQAATALAGCAGNTLSTAVSVTFTSFTGTATLTAAGLPSGITYTFTPASVTATGTSTLALNIGAGTTPGIYNITVTGTGGTVTGTANIALTVSSGIPIIPVLATPLDAATGVGINPTYTWTGGAGGTYDIQVATDPAFTTIISAQMGLTTNTYTPTVTLVGSTTYYWRVRATNGCGSSAYSSVFSFTTGALFCTTVNGTTGLPLTIPDNVVVNATLNFIGNGSITDVNLVNMTGTHTRVRDFTVTLISPAGTQVQLFNRPCSTGGANFNLGYDDAAASNTLPCPPIGGGMYIPVAALSAFNGENPLGTWTLRISDIRASNTGALTAWSLQVCYLQTTPSCMTAFATPTNVSCNGTSTGSSLVTTTGGTAPFTYSWSNSSTANPATGLAAGTYTVTITDNTGCTATANTTITQPLALTTVLNVTATSGAGCTGIAQVTATGGVVPYTYNWSNSTTTRTITALCAGTYTVTVTDGNGCTSVISRNVTVTVTPLAATLNNVNATCNGVCNGTSTAQVTGGVTPYTYLWSNGSTANNPTNLCVGANSVTITDANGSTLARTATITQTSPLVINTSSMPNYNNSPNCNGSATANGSGGGVGATYTYNWSNGGTGSTISNVCHGNYTVTVTSSAGCVASMSVTVSNFVGVDLPEGVLAFDISPNPHHGRFVVSMSFDKTQNATLQLFAADGKLVYSYLFTAKELRHVIETDQLPSGVYLLRLITDQFTSTKKVVKQ